MDDSSSTRPTVYMERCSDCGCRMAACPDAAPEPGAGFSETPPTDCGGCAVCDTGCPEDAGDVSFAIVWAEDAPAGIAAEAGAAERDSTQPGSPSGGACTGEEGEND